MMGVCVLYCKQYALSVLFVIEKPIIHIYCRGRWDLVMFWEIYVKPVTKVFVLEWAVYWWIIPVLQLSFFQIWSSYVLSAEPTTNMPSDETLFWLVTCCCCMVYSSTGWRTAVYSTLHKVVSPGEFLMDQFRNDVALWVKNYEDATMPYLLNQKM